MDAIVITTQDGQLIPLVQNRQDGIAVINRAEQRTALLSDELVDVEVEASEPLPLRIGDTLLVFNRRYSLNETPEALRLGHNWLRYSLRFEGPQYDLIRCTYFDLDTSGVALSSSFSLTGTLRVFADVLARNLQRMMGDKWTLGQVTVPGENTLTGYAGQAVAGEFTAVKTLTFENENCLSVLQKLCSEWQTEFAIEPAADPAALPVRWVLNLQRAGVVRDDVFRYGDGNPLYQLTRKTGESSDFATRLYVFGGAKNLPVLYRADPANPAAVPQAGVRLRLPISASPTDSELGSYLEDADAIEQYGLIEGVKVFEEVFPAFTRTVEAVYDPLIFHDSGIGFNPMELESWFYGTDGYPVLKHRYFEKGQQPKVSFTSGNLAGYSFVISQFSEINDNIYLLPWTDERGMIFPSPDPTSPFRIQPGDSYTLIDLSQPEEYITAAEQKLLAVGSTYFAEHSRPPLAYRVDLNELYYQQLAGDTNVMSLASPPVQFQVGDRLQLIDAGLLVDEQVRILSLTRNVLQPYQYTLELGLAPKVSALQRVLAKQTQITQTLKRNAIQLPAPGQGAGSSQQLTPATQADIDQRIRDALGSQPATRHTLGATLKLPEGFADALNEPAGSRRHSLGVLVKDNDVVLGNATTTARKRAIPSSSR